MLFKAQMEQSERVTAFPSLLRRLLLLEFAIAAVLFMALTWRWMLICDSPIIHYVNFLIAHGLKPYSEITDNNLPGAYLTEAAGMKLFGTGDVAWRVYEFFLLCAATFAMAVVSRPYDWAAGVFAGGVFMLMHGKEGPWFAGERELVMTTLVMAGYAALFTATRRRQPWWTLPSGFCFAFATAIKPTILPLSLLLLVWLILLLKRAGAPWQRYVLYGTAGALSAVICNAGYLLAHHALIDFLHVQRTITPYYAALTRLSAHEMLIRLVPPRPVLLIMLVGVVLALANRRWKGEEWALAMGAVVGLLSYWEQGKGFLHHRYMLFLFLLLLTGIEAMRALRSRRWQRWLSIGLLLFTAGTVPITLASIRNVKPDSDLTLQMESDLNRLAAAGDIQRRVQCLDLVYGCLNALYHLHLVENTGFTGDLLIFDPANGPAVQAHRAMWWRLQQEHPADILVVTNEFFQGDNGYAKLDNWPAYRRYMDEHYLLRVQRSFPMETGHYTDPAKANGYRIYVRRGSPFVSIPLDASTAAATTFVPAA